MKSHPRRPGITSGVMSLTPPDARQIPATPRRLPLACATVCALVGVATPAFASETLELTPDLIVTCVLLVSFVLLVSPLNRLIFQPLLKVMDDREEKIEGSRQRAERVQQQAQEALERYEAAIREAHEDSVAERRSRIDTARAELAAITRQAKDDADRVRARAREELSASLGAARETLRSETRALASLAAERVLGRSLS